MKQDYLKDHLSYDPETGVFIRLSTGEVAGHPQNYTSKCPVTGIQRVRPKGLYIQVGDRKYNAGTLATVYMTGHHPREIKFIDGNRFNTKWDNIKPSAAKMALRTKPDLSKKEKELADKYCAVINHASENLAHWVLRYGR